ncbi:MAG: threonylcarbamoyl-AMP synthase [Candidatus Lokiarchaeota archaeon]|nr:threonylcarbamoyl-AMP synthase [Candidatus Lokiarchaeota archaeon]MBD3339833.1 threonylcarbamoyl-AMP synthase [Candidatus Lokiarchaeota archaeon]
MGFLVKVTGKKVEDLGVYLENAVDVIIQGGILAFPTNSVYGIGGDPLNINLIDKICNIKFREKEKGFLLLLSDYEEASKIVEFSDTAKKLANRYWPGELTLILKRKSPNIIPLEVSGFKESLGIRVPKNKIVSRILNLLKERGQFGGIIGTSANYSGEPPSTSGAEIAKKFLGPIDYIIDAGKTKSQVPTTIVDCTEDRIKFIRIGKIQKDEIQEFLDN